MDIEVRDAAAYEEYKGEVPRLVAKHGGEYLVRGGPHEVIEGTCGPAPLALAWGVAVRVLLVGDDVLARAGLLALLVGRGDLLVVGQASSDDSARFAEEADVVLWDAGAGGGVDADWLEDADRPVVALVADPRQAAASLAAGARGVLPRDVPADRVGAALVSASEGLLVVDESFADSLLGRRALPHPLVEPLTPREVEVLGLLAEGLANKTIAARLAISESTVKFHVNAILGKLGAENRSEAIVQAARRGLVAL